MQMMEIMSSSVPIMILRVLIGPRHCLLAFIISVILA